MGRLNKTKQKTNKKKQQQKKTTTTIYTVSFEIEDTYEIIYILQTQGEGEVY